MTKFSFETLIDEALADVTTVADLKAALNKRYLSFFNDFEDGSWRFKKFQSYLWDNVAQTALSQRERMALQDQSHSALLAAAKNLRLSDNDIAGQGSEIAEIFLYGVMRHHFNALPVVPKIFYKQNSQDNAKGADSVHIVIDGTDFQLWFGEAKFYKSIADARLNAVVSSVFEMLSTSKLKKENTIITNIADLDLLSIDPALVARIKSVLDARSSIDELRSRIHVPIMLLHECSITSGKTEMSKAYKDELIEHHRERAEAYFSKQIGKSSGVYKYKEIKFHLILFPVPDKQIIVDAFTKNVSFYKEQA
ncbi:hypothetical protein BJF95_08550 [Rhizobium oryziradicis]|uniref:Anti-bacteriophage protein A/HamA C-terminal domain-containing protein n=1 Tax=Rhizobium oryziradicis TaxID=1867956 RepID=A0A1Q8ZRN2_9HYPH|nr:hypothetical protein BJF95_08550 [Rhizobium oryziradicis]